MASNNKTHGIRSSKLWQTAYAGLLAWVLASGCHPAPPPSSTIAADASTKALSPRVYFVASKRACANAPTEAGTRIDLGIDADLRYAKTNLDSTVAIVEGADPLHEAKQKLAMDAAAGRLVSGVVLFYTGHGIRREPSHPSAQSGKSMLCAGEEPADLSKLVQDVADLRPPWAVFVINACESSFVDISRVKIPVALISASPRPITVHNTTQRACAPEADAELPPTPFATAFVDALAHPGTAYDANHDATISTRELVYAIRESAFDAEKQCRPSFIDPHLQLNAPSDLPIKFIGPGVSPSNRLASALATLDAGTNDDRRVAEAVRLQLGRTNLPAVDFDWIATNEADKAHCNAGALRSEVQTSPGRATFRCPPAGLAWDQLKELAAFMSFMDVFELRPRGAFLDVIRMRDERLMSTTRVESPLEAVPRRVTRVLERADGRDVYRVLGVMPPDQGFCPEPRLCSAIKSREFAVCWEEEGQCFTAKRDAE